MKRNDWILYGGAALVAFGMVKFSQKQKLCDGKWLASVEGNIYRRFLNQDFAGNLTPEERSNVKPGDRFNAVYANTKGDTRPTTFIVFPVKIIETTRGGLTTWPLCYKRKDAGFLLRSQTIDPRPWDEEFLPGELIHVDGPPVSLDDIRVWPGSVER